MGNALTLDGKVAIVTGGAGGIGSATVQLMISRGARVAVLDINTESAQAVAAPFGVNALAVGMDLADEPSIVAAVRRVHEHFGRIDVLHNNAAIAGAMVDSDGAIADMRTEVWDAIFKVNCCGTMIAMREALPHLVATRGSIINTVSGQALQGHIRLAAYSATKAALIQMTRSTATAYGRSGVRCNAVAPGLILTETVARDFPLKWRKLVEDETPLDRGAGGPEDIAEVVAFLASDAARNITGQTIVSDGGVSIHVPGLNAYLEAYSG